MRERAIRLVSSAWFIALVAMLLRLAYVRFMAHQVAAEVLAIVPFQNEVGNVASALAQGKGFCCLFRQPTGPTAWLAPLYPLLVAGIFKVSGIFSLRSFYAAVVLNCLFSSLATIPLFHAGKRTAGTATATLAGWIWAFFPSGIILPFAWIWDTSLSVFFAAALLWSTLELEDSVLPRSFGLYGLLWGLALLTNPALGALLPFLIGWLLYQHRSNRPLQLHLGLTTLALVMLTCLPWAARNYVQFHRLIPLRSNFAYEFWSGNNEIFDEHSRAVNRITRYEQIRLYAQLGETEFLNEKRQDVLEFVKSHTALYLQLTGNRIVATWIGSESPWRDFQRTDSRLAQYLLVWNSLALLGIVCGLVRLHVERGEYFFPIASFPFFFPITFYIAHTSLRHRHPCDPVLALLIAISILGARIRRTAK